MNVEAIDPAKVQWDSQPQPSESDLAQQGAAMAAQDTSAPEAFMIGAGRTADKTIAGVEQALLGALSYVPGPLSDGVKRAQQNLAATQAENDVAYNALKQFRPASTGLGEALPYFAIPASAGTAGGAALVGAMGASQYGTPRQRALKGLTDATGALVGSKLADVPASILSPGPGISASKQAALDAARAIGYRPRLSEVTGSPYIANVEDAVARTPGGEGVMAQFGSANRAAINRAAANSIGENVTEITPQVFANARARITAPFEAVAKLPGRPIHVGPQLGQAADDVLTAQAKALQPDKTLVEIAKQAKMWAQGRGRLDGQTYNLLRSGLSEASYDASGTTRTLYGKLLNALDQSADSSLRAAGHETLADALKPARQQYANLLTLEKGATAEGGSISAAKVASSLRTSNAAAFREGRMSGNPLYSVAQIGENLKPLRAGSQTYERGVHSSLIDSLLKAPFAYTAAKAVTSPLLTGYARFAANSPSMATAGLLANRAALSGTLAGAQPLFSPFLLTNSGQR